MIGQTISHFKILEKLGTGGMGVVYKAQDLKLDRYVALKFLPQHLTEDEQAKKRFIYEAKAASALDHTNICTVYEIDETSDGRMFIAMAYYEGESLKERLERSPLEVAETLEIISQIARGLVKAHERNITHRDIKPANILLAPEEVVKIVDFGLAKLEGRTKVTKTGTTVGTVAYMSPEQVQGEEVDHRTDIWSLGVVLYEMLTGEFPFPGDQEAAVMHRIVNEEPLKITDHDPNLPSHLQTSLDRLLAKAPQDRYQTLADFSADLRFGDRTPKSVRPSGYRSRRTLSWIKRILILPLIAAAGIAAWYFIPRPSGGEITLGRPTRVTRARAWEGQPAISPNGISIVYCSDVDGNTDIYLTDVYSAKPLRLTTDPAIDDNPAWLPDGSAILFASTRGGTKSIWRMDPLGGGKMMILTNAKEPSVSPDGKTLAFTRRTDSGVYRIATTPLSDPALVTMITEDPGVWDQAGPSWSPDGKWLVFAGYDNLWIVGSGGEPARPLTRDSEDHQKPVWIPNSNNIVFSSWRDQTTALWTLRLPNGPVRRLTLGTGSETRPSVSRDGKRMAYATDQMEMEVALLDIDSNELTALPELAGAWMPALSPDGKQVVVVADWESEHSNLWLLTLEDGAASGSPRRLTDDPIGRASHPAFSPDGTLVAYYRKIGDTRDIWIVPVKGGEPRRIIKSDGSDVHPAWAPDGQRMAFVSDRSGSSKIWLVDIQDGKPIGQPSKLASSATVAELAPAWSPADDVLAFVAGDSEGHEVWVEDPAKPSSRRRLTSGAGALCVDWETEGSLLVSGYWGENVVELRRVRLADGHVSRLGDGIYLGTEVLFGMFSVGAQQKRVVISNEARRGDIWVVNIRLSD
jgi:Tol biopolymer transport system component